MEKNNTSLEIRKTGAPKPEMTPRLATAAQLPHGALALAALPCGMESSTEIRERWTHLRDLLIEQLGRFEDGTLQMTTGGDDVSAGAIARLKKKIEDFDAVIAQSEARDARKP